MPPRSSKKPEFVEAFGDVGALSIVEAGAPAQELDMPEPAEAQHDCHAIIVTLFDLFRDTRLETSAQAIAWGFVNSFHFEAAKLAREEDALSLELGEMVRHPDSSEIYAVELEELQLRTQAKMEQRARNPRFQRHHRKPDRRRRLPQSSRNRPTRTARAERPACRLFGRAGMARSRTNLDPLDQIKARVPNMTLCTTAQRKGADAIATAWAASKGVPVVAFTPNTARHGKRAGFVCNDQLAGLRPVEAIVCEGSGIQANLLDSLKKAGVPTHAFRHSNQAPAPQRSMWG